MTAAQIAAAVERDTMRIRPVRLLLRREQIADLQTALECVLWAWPKLRGTADGDLLEGVESWASWFTRRSRDRLPYGLAVMRARTAFAVVWALEMAARSMPQLSQDTRQGVEGALPVQRLIQEQLGTASPLLRAVFDCWPTGGPEWMEPLVDLRVLGLQAEKKAGSGRPSARVD